MLRKEFCSHDHFEKIKLIVYLFVMIACHNVALNNGIARVEMGSIFVSRLVVFDNPPKRNNVDHIGCFVSFRVY